MKKLLLVLAIGSFVACNDGGSADAEKTADSTATPTVDTAAPAPLVDTTAPSAVDTTKKVDTIKKK
jgi:hypothetical protein